LGWRNNSWFRHAVLPFHSWSLTNTSVQGILYTEITNTLLFVLPFLSN
jgi:hypothetical protein